jgi:uroporphyrinogen decarboxylase
VTSAQRLLAAAARKPVDRIPVAPYMGNYGAVLAGVPIDRYCRSGALMAEAQIRAWEMLGQDAVVAQSDNYYIAEGFGLRVDHHPDGTPTAAEVLVHDLARIRDLSVPDPRRHGRMPVYLEAIELLARRFGGQVAVRAPGTGPFSLAGHLIGAERFVMELATLAVEPDQAVESALRRLMDLTTDALIAFARACLEAGAQIVQAGDSLASIDMISPAIYESWAWPSERRFFGEVAADCRRHGAVSLLHICGDNTRILERMADTGADILEIDHKVSLETAKRLAGGRVCLMGNLDPAGLLLRGTPDGVAVASRRAIRAAGPDGFILGSGCEVPPRAPLTNMRAMVAAAGG